MGYKGEIGITLNTHQIYPLADTREDIEAAKREHAYSNRWFMDPILKGSYPQEILDWYKGKVIIPTITPEDIELISTPIDFLGINNYFALKVSEDKSQMPLQLKEHYIGEERTDIGWGINPEGFYDVLMQISRDYNGVKIYITENGAAFRDSVNREGRVEDDNRLDYLYRYLNQVNKAIEDGANIKAYYVWSLMDNFEWDLGFTKRFGIVYVDYESQKRIIKKSGYWFKNVISENGFEKI